MSEISCPNCNSTNTCRILYGLAEPTEKLMQDLDAGKVHLGGCIMTNHDPNRHCNDCEVDFDSKNTRNLKNYQYGNLNISLLEHDITKHTADIIVNAANETLVGEDGVDGAIHIAAGPELQAECNQTGYCAVTDVVVTKAYFLPAKHVFHTVGPQWNGDAEVSEKLLQQTYYNNLIKGEEIGLQSIAFPSISTGQYGVPTDIGARSFAQAIAQFATQEPKYLTDVRMMTHYDPDFDEQTDAYEQYEKQLANLANKQQEAVDIYLDIDGVLLANDLTPANYAKEFLSTVLERYPYSTYWLTTHCDGDANVPIQHIGHLFDAETVELMKMIKPTSWQTAKTKAINFNRPFLWFDDDLFYEEKQDLTGHGVLDNWIKVDLAKNPDQLADFVASFPLPTEK